MATFLSFVIEISRDSVHLNSEMNNCFVAVYPFTSDLMTHEAIVLLSVSRHLTLIYQRQLTTCILSDSASCDCDKISCTTHFDSFI